jgi:hypothetical protein
VTSPADSSATRDEARAAGRTVTLVVLCEGPTEQNFVAQSLAPHLRGFRVFARPQLLAPRRVPADPVEPAGGVVKFRALRDSVSRVLAGRRHECVTTMLDLYALPKDYPGWEPQRGETGAARASRIEAAMHTHVPDPRFVPYVQVHEFEALVLSDLDALAARFPDDRGAAVAAKLREDIGDAEPEQVNTGKETAPSKRILRVLPAYQKAVDGPTITAQIGLAKLRSRCHHFAGWLERLERLSPS